MENPTKQFFTIAETAAIMDVHKMTITREIKRGKLNATHIGAAVRISLHDIEEYTGSLLGHYEGAAHGNN
ncbi:hypothetical protein AGMMS49991_04670 [Spirochaetia bacterium]|nr:hypothetical protein AGMMS49991_04670 [Spirochaetia bacterium]